MSEHLESASLALRIAAGDKEAEEELVQVYGQRIWMLIKARTGDIDGARDLTHDVLVSVLRALRNDQLKKPESLAAFIFSTARNQASNHLRRGWKRTGGEPLRPDVKGVWPTDAFQVEEKKALFLESLKHLDATERQILVMTLVEGLKSGEIANRLGIKPELLRKRKSRAIQKVIEFIRSRR